MWVDLIDLCRQVKIVNTLINEWDFVLNLRALASLAGTALNLEDYCLHCDPRIESAVRRMSSLNRGNKTERISHERPWRISLKGRQTASSSVSV